MSHQQFGSACTQTRRLSRPLENVRSLLPSRPLLFLTLVPTAVGAPLLSRASLLRVRRMRCGHSNPTWRAGSGIDFSLLR